MVKKKIGIVGLIIIMARYIKSESKLMGDEHTKTIRFDVSQDESGEMCISFNGSSYVPENIGMNDAPYSIVERAIKESGQNCLKVLEDNGYNVTIIGKPVKEFNMLQRLVKKYANVDIGDFVLVTMRRAPGDGLTTKDTEHTSCLCHNSEACQKGIDFIRSHRTSKNVLHAKVYADYDNDECEASMRLRLDVKTKGGKPRAYCTISA
jgi:hypothetical protein